jgi:D-alanyl-D-alanine carboxypeptidase
VLAAAPASAATHAAAGRIGAASYVAIDAASGRVLVGRGEHVRRPIASLTKVMTALVVIESGGLERKVRVPRVATRVEPNKDYLVAGRWYPRMLLLYSALLASNNDAAAALGYDAGGGSLRRFYERMTQRARSLGMGDTTYRSASGLNDLTNLSTAYDQALLGRAALRNPLLARIVGTRRKAFPRYGRAYVNHNKMLFTYRGTLGIKTGWTTAAGGCLLTAVERDGHTVVAVLLHSDSIWTDMPRLLRRAFARLESVAPAGRAGYAFLARPASAPPGAPSRSMSSRSDARRVRKRRGPSARSHSASIWAWSARTVAMSAWPSPVSRRMRPRRSVGSGRRST